MNWTLGCRVPLRKFALDLTRGVTGTCSCEALSAKEAPGKVSGQCSRLWYDWAGGGAGLKGETDMVALNCEALCAVTRMVLPYMECNSRIIQYASSAAFLPQPGFAIYAATKSFVLSYSRALNQELRSRRIYVTAVCPGPVKTEFFDIAESTGVIPLYKRLVMANQKRVVQRPSGTACRQRDFGLAHYHEGVPAAVQDDAPPPASGSHELHE